MARPQSRVPSRSARAATSRVASVIRVKLQPLTPQLHQHQPQQQKQRRAPVVATLRSLALLWPAGACKQQS